MDIPTVDPFGRKEVPPAGDYRATDPVWVFRHGHGWNPGRVLAAAAAVLVEYHLTGQRAILTDTVTDIYLMRRDGHDPLLDGEPPGRPAPSRRRSRGGG